MGTLEKLGLIVLVFGAALHTWHYIPTLLLSVALMTAGGGLFLTGAYVTGWLRRRWPDVRW